MSKVYVYPRGRANHPLNPEIQTETAQAIDEEGQELVAFYGSSETDLKKQAQEYDWEKGTKIVWVDRPDEHHTIPGLLAKREESAREADMVTRAKSSRWTFDELEIIKGEHHICDGCDRVEVCALSSLPMVHAQRVVIAGCLQYKPKEQDETDQELSTI